MIWNLVLVQINFLEREMTWTNWLVENLHTPGVLLCLHFLSFQLIFWSLFLSIFLVFLVMSLSFSNILRLPFCYLLDFWFLKFYNLFNFIGPDFDFLFLLI
jgi:hypothetical protein